VGGVRTSTLPRFPCASFFTCQLFVDRAAADPTTRSARSRRPLNQAESPKIGRAEQRAVNAPGDAHGCWTPGCGARVPGTKPQRGRPQGNWVGDHQLPNSLTAPGAPQFLVPHCVGCSREQGLFLARLVNWFNGANE
jgi:hypothetical protein